MNADILERYTSRLTPPVKQPGEEPEVQSDLGAFGILRGIRERALMLEFRQKNGSATAFSYAYLSQAAFDPSEGLMLHFGGSIVRIVGTNLNAEVLPNVYLFQALLRHRVTWIKETENSAAMQAAPKQPVIDHIEIG